MIKDIVARVRNYCDSLLNPHPPERLSEKLEAAIKSQEERNKALDIRLQEKRREEEIRDRLQEQKVEEKALLEGLAGYGVKEFNFRRSAIILVVVIIVLVLITRAC